MIVRSFCKCTKMQEKMLHPLHTKGMKHVSSTVPPRLRLGLYNINKVSAALTGCNGPSPAEVRPPRSAVVRTQLRTKPLAPRSFACGGSLSCANTAPRLSASWLCQDEDSLFIAHANREVKRESFFGGVPICDEFHHGKHYIA